VKAILPTGNPSRDRQLGRPRRRGHDHQHRDSERSNPTHFESGLVPGPHCAAIDPVCASVAPRCDPTFLAGTTAIVCHLAGFAVLEV
jgi:hypothetical protein